MRISWGVLRKWGVVSLAAAALLIGSVGAAYAQEATGTITGTATDQKGLAMTGVTVTVHSNDTGVDMKPVLTNESGLYVVPLLQPGSYDVTAMQAGFATVQNKGVTVGVATTLRIDFEMPVATQQSLVTVTTEVPVLETEKTEQAQNVSETLVSDLPVSSRRWEQFVQLTPGLTPDGTTGLFSFHGINSNYNNNSVDGANNMSNYNAASRGGTADGYTYSGDSVREFQVESGSFNAELGQAAGGSVNAITKSGTGQFHGDLFFNGRATPFNAYDPISKASAAAVAATAPNSAAATPGQTVKQQYQWGGSLGGPIIKDKLFFFVTDDGYRRSFPLLDSTTQVSPAIDQLPCPTPTASSTLTGAQISALAAGCLSAKSFVDNHVLGTFPRNIRQDIELVKLDYQVNQSNHLSGVVNVRDWKEPTSLQSAQLAAAGGAVAPTQGTAYLQDRFAIVTLNTVIGNNKVNELRYQYGVDNSFSTLDALYGAPQVALSGLFTYGQSNGTAHTDEFRNQVSDNFSLTKGTHTIKFGVDINIIQDIARSATNSNGAYSYTSGSIPANFACAPNGTASALATTEGIFCNWIIDITGTPSTPAAGGGTGQNWQSYAQVLDNVFTSAPQTFTYNFFDKDYAGYIQDTWKARPNLTINYGLRYDVQQLPVPPFSSTIVLGANDLPILAHYTDTIKNQLNAFQPRVGLAWNFRKNSVFRLGGGIFYGKTVGSAIKTIVSGAGESNVNCSTPVTTTTKCVLTTSGGGSELPGSAHSLQFPDLMFSQQDIGPNVANQIFPGSIAGQVIFPNSTGIAALPGGLPNPSIGVRAIDPNAVRPKVYEFEAAIEQQLPGNINFSATYSFTRGVQLPSQEDANIATNYDASFCTTAAAAGTTQQCGTSINKSYDVVNATGTTQQTSTVPFFYTRVDPRTGPIITQFSDVLSTYNGFIFTVRKPVSHGLELLANYTLAWAFDDGQAGSGISGENFLSTDGVLSPYNRALEYGPSATDVRNRFTASIVYAPTFGKNFTNKIAKGFADGWSLSSTIVASNGTHYSETVSTTGQQNLSLTGYAPGQTAGTTAFAFTGPDGGVTGVDIQTTGNNIGGRVPFLPRNYFTLPNLYNIDFRLSKEWTIKERYNIEMRGEAFNLFNSTLVQAVSTNGYSLSNASATSATCWNGTGSMPAGTPVHASNATCMVPVANFQAPVTTSGLLLGPRQLQAGVRFTF